MSLSKRLECDMCEDSVVIEDKYRPAYYGQINLGTIRISVVTDGVLDLCPGCIIKALNAWGWSNDKIES